MRRIVYKSELGTQSSHSLNNRCIINHIISTKFNEILEPHSINVQYGCCMWCNDDFYPNLHIFHSRGEFRVTRRAYIKIVIGTAFMSHELPHSLISLNFFGYVSICRVFFSYANFFFLLCRMTIATEMTIRHSTTYVNEEI